MATRVTGGYSPKGGGFGPIRYGTNLYAVLLSSTVALGGTDQFSLFKSEDDGATWAAVGTPIGINSYVEGIATVDQGNYIHGCLDNAFPASPYGYIVHLNDGSGGGVVPLLLVTRVNFDTETFDSTSADGPNFYTGGTPEGAGNDGTKFVPAYVTWAIAQFDDSSFGVLATLQSGSASTNGRVYAMTLSADLTTWSARTEISGQNSSHNVIAGITKGASDRIHGFVYSSDQSLWHVLVEASAGPLQEISNDSDWNYQSTYSAALVGTQIRCLAVTSVGNELQSWYAESADTPTFTLDSIDSSAALFNSLWACLIGGAAFITGYDLDNASDDTLKVSQYSGGWSTPTSITVGQPYSVTGQRLTSASAGFLFAEDGTDDETYFALYGDITPVTGGCCCKIVGIYGAY